MTPRGLRALTSALAALGLLLIALSFVPGSARADDSTSTGNAWTASETLTRTFGNGTADDVRTFEVTADRHTNLQDHERINLTWSGAHPTQGRVANPFGENGLGQEYPVLIMECRGVDPQDGSAVPDGAEQVSPETCWTNTWIQRSAQASPGRGVWQQDADATDAEKGHVSGIDPSDIPSSCAVNDSLDYHITPFLAADGTLYPGCSSQSMPPEAATGSVSIPNEIAAFTDAQGNGTASFEVRTDVENESLGCSATVACTLVVIPIDGINCAAGNDDEQCNSTGVLSASGQSGTPAPSVAPGYWWSPSNWSRRISIPLAFAEPPSVCSLSTTAGTPVPFYGSELMSQAALQWTPAYCLNPDRFNWQDNVMADDAAFELMSNGQAAAALVSGARDGENVGYAPTAVTGWAIAFDIDKPNNAGQQMSLKLDARLLAKLLTESYPGTILGKARPGLQNNPFSLNLDPEFQKLNPGLDKTHFGDVQATLLSLSTSSDVISQISSYIATDPAAMAFVNGKPDPWGMKVNPAYRGMTLPVSTWPLLDTWVNNKTGNPCIDQNHSAYMPLLASPVSSFRLIATDMLYNWPNVTTGCSGNGANDTPYQLARVQPLGVGNRFMLGVVTLADARRYGLTVASLEASPGHYVAPTDASMAAAVKLGKQVSPQQPFTISEADIHRSPTAYPGTMIVYTAAKTKGLDAEDVKHVTQFIKVSSTEGQQPGRGNGQLPAGYVPITPTGATAALYKSDQVVMKAIARQSGTPLPPSGGDPGDGGGSPGGGTPGGTGSTTPPDTPLPPADATPSGGATPTQTATDVPVVKTAAVTSATGGGLMVVLLVVGIAAGLVGVGGRIVLMTRGVK